MSGLGGTPSIYFAGASEGSDHITHRRFETSYRPLILAETWMDLQAELIKFKAWMRGLILVGGFSGAHQAAAGLA